MMILPPSKTGIGNKLTKQITVRFLSNVTNYTKQEIRMETYGFLFYLIGNCYFCNFLYYTKVYLNPPRLGLMLAGGKRLSTTGADSGDRGLMCFLKHFFIYWCGTSISDINLLRDFRYVLKHSICLVARYVANATRFISYRVWPTGKHIDLRSKISSN